MPRVTKDDVIVMYGLESVCCVRCKKPLCGLCILSEVHGVDSSVVAWWHDYLPDVTVVQPEEVRACLRWNA